jgi:fluoride ion exporter CrcB/FEX
MTGLTAAILLGVPAGTWIGAAYGWRAAFVFCGLLGGLTTFSFFSYENLELLRDERYMALIVNAAGQVVIGVFTAAAGYKVSALTPGPSPETGRG